MEIATNHKKTIFLLATILGLALVAVLGFLLWQKRPLGNTKPLVKIENISLGSGSAQLTQVNNQTSVVIVLDNDTSPVPHPVHIHVGSCPKPGAIKYSLNSIVNGRSETKLPVTLDQLQSQLPLALNIHKSPLEPQISITCGDIK